MRSYTVTTEKVGLMKANCYIIKSRESDNAVVVDPGREMKCISKAYSEIRMQSVC